MFLFGRSRCGVVDSASKWADYQVRHILQSHTKWSKRKKRISDRNIRWSSPPPMHPAPSRRCCKSGRLLTLHWLLVADQSAGGGLGFPRGGACRLHWPTECRDNAEDSHSPPPTAPVFPSYFFEPKNLGYIPACWPLELNILSATVLQAQRLILPFPPPAQLIFNSVKVHFLSLTPPLLV